MILPKMSAYRKDFEIWDKVRNIFLKRFDSEPVYNVPKN